MSFRNATLSPSHYAHGWRIASSENLNDREAVNRLAIEYASLPDGAEKEAKCLEIVQCFHGYLMKYLHMIVRGHLPSLKTPAGKDAAKLLSILVKGGTKADRDSIAAACRSLHLAFKQNSADDIYDTLVICLMRAIRKYDPFYTDKIRTICDTIDRRYRRRDDIILEPEVSKSVGHASLSCLRMLVKRGNLVSVVGPKKKVLGYRRTKAWTDRSFLEQGPVGFVYFLPMYFRYYLHEHISEVMQSVEAQEGVLQLEGLKPANPGDNPRDIGTPHAGGAVIDQNGQAWAADVTLMNLQLDVSEITNAWVRHTEDKLFKKLTIRERHILQMRFAKEYSWPEVSAILEMDQVVVKKEYDQMMQYLKGRAGAR